MSGHTMKGFKVKYSYTVQIVFTEVTAHMAGMDRLMLGLVLIASSRGSWRGMPHTVVG